MSKDIIANEIERSMGFAKMVAESKYMKEDVAEY